MSDFDEHERRASSLIEWQLACLRGVSLSLVVAAMFAIKDWPGWPWRAVLVAMAGLGLLGVVRLLDRANRRHMQAMRDEVARLKREVERDD